MQANHTTTGEESPLPVPYNDPRINRLQATGITEPYFLPASEEAPDYEEQVAEICQGLQPTECRTFLLAVRDHKSMAEIATAENVSHATIRRRFRRMARKNPYVRIWQQHEKLVAHANNRIIARNGTNSFRTQGLIARPTTRR